MKRRLSKEESRRRYAEGRRLWNEFDPIGVVDDEIDDEYESYVGPCLRIVEAGESEDKLTEYVRWVVYEHMGLSPADGREEAVEAFAKKFTEWYRSEWNDTVV